MSEIRDTDYGDYTSFSSNDDYTWRDLFWPRKKDREEAQARYEEAKRIILEEIASDNGLDTSEWTNRDFDEFMEVMDLY